MKTSFFKHSAFVLLCAGALSTAPACSDVEQDEMFPITIIGELALADAEGYPLNTNDELPVIIGTPVQLRYSFAPTDATRPELTFTTADPSVATVSAEGLITGVSDGHTTLTVAPAHAYSTSVAIRLNVVTTPTLVSAIEFVAESIPESFFVGQTARLEATAAPADATFKRLVFSSLDEEIATVTPEGLLTGVSKGDVTIRCSATDGSEVYVDVKLFVDQVIPVQKADLIPPVNTDPTDYTEWAVGESCQLTYTMEPANASSYTLQWSSSNEDVARVTSEGKVLFLKGGTVAITLTCPETGYASTVDLTVGEGFVRDNLDDENNLRWEVNPSHIKSGATMTWYEKFVQVSTYVSNSQGRADWGHVGNVTLHAGNYPILAIKMTNPLDTHKDSGVTQCRITLDAAPGLGAYGNTFNKYAVLADPGDGIPVYYYDLKEGTFGGSKVKLSDTAPTDLTTLQFKVADMKTITAPVQYNVYWIRTFKSVEDLEAFAKAHPEEAPSF